MTAPKVLRRLYLLAINLIFLVYDTRKCFLQECYSELLIRWSFAVRFRDFLFYGAFQGRSPGKGRRGQFASTLLAVMV